MEHQISKEIPKGRYTYARKKTENDWESEISIMV